MCVCRHKTLVLCMHTYAPTLTQKKELCGYIHACIRYELKHWLMHVCARPGCGGASHPQLRVQRQHAHHDRGGLFVAGIHQQVLPLRTQEGVASLQRRSSMISCMQQLVTYTCQRVLNVFTQTHTHTLSTRRCSTRVPSSVWPRSTCPRTPKTSGKLWRGRCRSRD
jgi:hypothetical protein